MSRGGLVIGWATGPTEGVFTLPLDGATKAYAINGIRESGKSSLATVMAEEYCKLKQPWIALDPVGNWWGLRALPDGRPGGHPVVVFGGERGDLPLEKGDGRKIAEAVTQENVFAVIDLKLTSKTIWRTLVRDMVGALLELQPRIPRMVFLEEAGEFIPQSASYQLGRECSEICERLVTLGGNYGYGATLIGQRPADIAKKALSQCETVFAFATQGKRDRDALQDWMESQHVGEAERKALGQLADLPTGECYAWSPRFLKTFARIRIRRRETFHPRDARRLGVSVRDVELAPVEEFVAKVRKQLTKVQAAVPAPAPGRREIVIADGKKAAAILKAVRHPLADEAVQHANAAAEKLQQQVFELEKENALMRAERDGERFRKEDAERRLEAVRKHLKPEYDALRALFEDLGEAAAAGGAADRTVYEPWLAKASQKGCRRILEVLIERRQLTRNQLGTLAGVPAGKSTFRGYMSWLKSNGLVVVDGDMVRLRAV